MPHVRVDLAAMDQYLDGLRERNLSNVVKDCFDQIQVEFTEGTFRFDTVASALEDGNATDADRLVVGLLIDQLRAFLKDTAIS